MIVLRTGRARLFTRWALSATILALALGGAAMAAVIPVDDFENTPESAWSFTNGSEYPGARGSFSISRKGGYATSRCGILAWDFGGGGNYVQVSRSLPKISQVRSLRLWIKKPYANSIGVRFTDSQGQTFQKSFNFPKKDWQEVDISLGGWAVSWGGKGDGVFRGDPTLFGILVDNNADKTGTLLFDDLRLVTEDTSADTAGPVTYTVQTLSGHSFGGDVSLFGQPASLALSVNAPAERKVRLVIGSHFHSYERELTTTISGAQTLHCDLGSMEDWEAKGSEKGIQYPLRLLGIQSDSGVRLEDLKVTTRIDPSQRVVLIPAGRMEKGTALFNVTLQSILPAATQGRLHCIARDWDHNQLAERSVAVSLPAGSSVTRRVSIPAHNRPFVELECRFVTSDHSYGPSTECAVAPEPELPPQSAAKGSPWGVGIYLYRFAGDPAGPRQMDALAAMAARAGVKWSREEMQWHRIEPEKGRFDWTFYDQLVDTAERHGISVYGLIAYWSSWTKPYTQEGIEDYARYCRALVSHYKDRIHYWEVYNEPNIFFWSGPKALYPELLKAAYAAIKEADPTAHVLGCSTAGIDSGFIDMVNRAKAPYDILTVHPYRPWLNEAAFIDDLRGAQKLTATDGKGKPVWITEMGWATPVGGTTQREQAQLLARCYLSAVAAQVDTNISWYDFRDDGNNPFYHEHHFGVIRNDMTPKPAYRALGTVCRNLPGATVAKSLNLPHGLMGYVYKTSAGPATVIWHPDQAAILRLSTGAGRIVNLMGEEVQPLSVAGSKYILLQPASPVLLTGDASSVINAQQPVLRVEDVAGLSKMRVTISGLPPGVSATVEAPPHWPASSVRGSAKVEWEMKPPESASGPYMAQLRLRAASRTLAVPVVLHVQPALLKV